MMLACQINTFLLCLITSLKILPCGIYKTLPLNISRNRELKYQKNILPSYKNISSTYGFKKNNLKIKSYILPKAQRSMFPPIRSFTLLHLT